MCGINLIVDFAGSLDDGPILKMNESLQDRGPDSNGILKFRNSQGHQVFLGSTRLKIQDTSDLSDQPFTGDSDDSGLSFNGEIYNFADLKNVLLSTTPYAFRSNSDTEVLWKWLKEDNNPAELNGMFAFAFVDNGGDKIILGRDRFGIKPLFYFSDDRFLIVSSEISGILASGLVKKDLNEDQIPLYLQFRYPLRPETFFKGIMELEPGSIAILKGKKIEVVNRISAPSEEAETSQSVERIRSLIENAVISQYNAAVPSGMYFSGGVDSTLLLAILSQAGISRYPVFTLGEGSDRAKRAAKHFNADYNEFQLPANLEEDFDGFIGGLDQPVGDSGALMNYILARNVKPYASMVLSGAGADELFAGYNRHHAFRYYLQNRKSLLWGKRPMILVANFLSMFRSERGRLLKKFSKGIQESPSATFGNFISTDLHSGQPPPQVETLDEMLELERMQYLISDVLTITDRMSMRSSIEVRVPYLDNELAAYVQCLPGEYLLSQGRKWILRKLLEDTGGKPFTKGGKTGFGLGLYDFKQRYSKDPWSISSDNPIHNFLSKDTISGLREDYNKANESRIHEVWTTIILSHWLQNEFG